MRELLLTFDFQRQGLLLLTQSIDIKAVTNSLKHSKTALDSSCEICIERLSSKQLPDYSLLFLRTYYNVMDHTD